MARMAPTVEKFLSDLPPPTVPKVTGEPTYKSIHTIHKILKEYAASVHINLGGGAHGHLALVLMPGHYQQVTGHVFNEPNHHPGPNLPNT
eukprot:27398-Ditylum_brightwellii.AAC.1